MNPDKPRLWFAKTPAGAKLAPVTHCYGDAFGEGQALAELLTDWT